MTHSVRLQHTSLQFNVEADETILAAALRQGISLPWGCGSGICGSCLVDVIQGEIIYPHGPPLALFEEDAENGKGLVCVGYACSDLLLKVGQLTGYTG